MVTASATVEREGQRVTEREATGTALSVQTQGMFSHNPGAIALFGKIDDPIAAATQLGETIYNSGICGAKNKAQGTMIFLACMSEGIALTDFPKIYHIIDGKLVKRADTLLADFNIAGGKHRWISKGEDGQSATLELSFQGKTDTATFTIQDATRMGLVKAGSNWIKSPANMLRARCITDGMGMHFPQFKAGTYSPEELGYDSIEHAEQSQPANVVAAIQQQGTATPTTTTRRRGKSIAATTFTAAATTTSAAVHHDNNVIDAEIVSKEETTNASETVSAPEAADTPEAVDVVGEVSEADESAENLEAETAEEAPFDNVEQTEVDSGESQHDPNATSTRDDGPCTQVQIDQIKSMVRDLTPKDPQQSSKINAALASMGKLTLADLSYGQAQGLLNALFKKAAELGS